MLPLAHMSVTVAACTRKAYTLLILKLAIQNVSGHFKTTPQQDYFCILVWYRICKYDVMLINSTNKVWYAHTLHVLMDTCTHPVKWVLECNKQDSPAAFGAYSIRVCVYVILIVGGMSGMPLEVVDRPPKSLWLPWYALESNACSFVTQAFHEHACVVYSVK